MNIKRIIAREGLIIIGIVVVGIIFSFVVGNLKTSIQKKLGVDDSFIADVDLEKIKTNILKMDTFGVSANEIDAYILSEGLTLNEANELKLRPKRDYYAEEIKGEKPKVILPSYSDEELLAKIGFTQSEMGAVKELNSFRKQYPQYNDLDDLTLTEKLSKKYPQHDEMFKTIKSILKPERVRPKVSNMVRFSIALLSATENFGYFLLFLGYPIYLIIRFIIWAVRTLGEAK